MTQESFYVLPPKTAQVLMPYNIITQEVSTTSNSTVSGYWKHVVEVLSKKINTEIELGDAIFKICTKDSDLERKSLNGIDDFFSRCISKEEKEKFFHSTLPKMQALVIRMPEMVPYIVPMLLQSPQQQQSTVTLSRQAVSVLMIGGFFGVFPAQNQCAQPTTIFNFVKFFRPDYNGRLQDGCVEKMKCLLVYFEEVTSKVPIGFISFHRQRSESPLDWISSQKKLRNLWVVDTMDLVESPELVKVGFSSKMIGGATLSKACYSEEILFSTHPELISAILFSSELSDDDCVIVKGAKKFAKSSGNSAQFKFQSPIAESTTTQRDNLAREECVTILIDPLHFDKIPKMDQFKEELLKREINKLFVGFSGVSKVTSLDVPIGTGNWGCTLSSAISGVLPKVGVEQSTESRNQEGLLANAISSITSLFGGSENTTTPSTPTTTTTTTTTVSTTTTTTTPSTPPTTLSPTEPPQRPTQPAPPLQQQPQQPQPQQQPVEQGVFGVFTRFSRSLTTGSTPTPPTPTPGTTVSVVPRAPSGQAITIGMPKLSTSQGAGTGVTGVTVNVGALMAGGGDTQLKAILQLLAAAEANKDLIYYHNDKLSCDSIREMYSFIVKKDLTVGQLYKVLLEIGATNQLFQKIVKYFNGDPTLEVPSTYANKKIAMDKISSGCLEKWNRSLKQCSVGVDLPRFLPKTTVIRRKFNITDEQVIFAAKSLAEDQKLVLKMKELLSVIASEFEIADFPATFDKYWDEKSALFDVSRATDEFLLKSLGENHPVSRLLKASSSQGIIAPVVLQLKMSILSDFPSKDHKGGWYIFITFDKNTVSVVHRKREISMIPDEYEIAWEVQMTFDIDMTAMISTNFTIIELKSLPSLSDQKKQLLDDIRELWLGKSFVSVAMSEIDSNSSISTISSNSSNNTSSISSNSNNNAVPTQTVQPQQRQDQ